MASDNFTTWRKATYSHANSNCVEVATGRQVVGVRDTVQLGSGPVLRFPVAAWRAFIDEARYQGAGHSSRSTCVASRCA
jgi:hypothetical protein